MTRGRMLTQWAQALGVDNDRDAIVALHDLMNRVDDARSVLQKANTTLADAPDPEAARGCEAAMHALEKANGGLLAVERRFHRHERGRKG